MIPQPLGLRLDPARPIREQTREAARLGARGVVLDAVGDLAPARLSDTGRRELRHLLRSVGLSLVALGLPTRRPFDTNEQLDDRLNRAEAAFTLAFDLGTPLVLARAGGTPAEDRAAARATFLGAVTELGRRADHRGVRLALETGDDSGPDARSLLDGLAAQGLAASLEPTALLDNGHDPAATARALGPWLAHAYAGPRPAPASGSFQARRGSLGPESFDLEAYLGALEEVNYRGYLTVWPDPAREPGPQFTAVADRLAAF